MSSANVVNVKSNEVFQGVAAHQGVHGVIDRAELQSRMAAKQSGRGSLQLLEALGEMYYARGHLPGALHFPHDRTRELAALMLPSRDDDIVVYCASSTCRNSHIAAGALRTLGYRRVSVYAGGKQDWQDAGLPLEV
jgi:rhodanese-related sulfurtransferase